MLKKLCLIIIILYFSIVLTTSSPFQNTTLFQNNMNNFVNLNIPSSYAEDDDADDDDDDDDDDNGKDDDDDDDEEKVDKVSLDDGNVPVTDTGNISDDSLLSFSSPVSNQSPPALPQPDNQLVSNQSPPKDSENFKNKV